MSNIKLNYLYLQYGSRKISPGKIPNHQAPPWKIPPGKSPLENPPWKIPNQKISIRNIPNHFINCLSLLNTSSINEGGVYTSSLEEKLLQNRYLQNSLDLSHETLAILKKSIFHTKHFSSPKSKI